MIQERVKSTISGWVMLPALFLAQLATAVWMIREVDAADEPTLLFWLLLALLLIELVMLGGFFVVNPNEAKVLILFGKYSGSVKSDGFHWANPLLSKKRISLRVHNFESSKIKVNDHEGNPIEIAAVIVWRVTETAEASFEVEDY